MVSVPTRDRSSPTRKTPPDRGDYRYDIFMSYRREPETIAWLHRHLLPLVKLRVGQELAYRPTVFLDEQIETGRTWPARLGQALGDSRILLALWSKDYFYSRWCVAELAEMMAREQASGLRADADAAGLVIPAVIHDGADFPSYVSHIQRFGIQTQFNVRMAHDSSLAAELDAILAREAPAIATAITGAPAWQPAWQTRAAQRLRKALLKTDQVRQARLPRYSDHG